MAGGCGEEGKHKKEKENTNSKTKVSKVLAFTQQCSIKTVSCYTKMAGPSFYLRVSLQGENLTELRFSY